MVELSKYVPDYISVRRMQAIGIGAICAYAALVRGGVYVPLQWPIMVMTLLLCGSLFFLQPDCRKRVRARFLNDPVFYLGLVFFLQLAVQFFNSDHALLDRADGALELSGSPTWFWPWALGSGATAEMMVWFFPPWVIVLLVRNVFCRIHIKIVLSMAIWTAAVIAGIGLLQAMFKMSAILGIWDISGNQFFATFEYSNHAAEWLYLNACLAGGMAHDALKRNKPMMQQIIWYASFLLCVAAGILTSSRLGAVISSVLLGIALAIGLKHVLRRVTRAAAVNSCIAASIVVLVGSTLFFGTGGGRLADEIQNKALIGESSVVSDLGGRLEQMPSAWAIICDYPIFGAGGWNYQWLAQLYTPEALWAKWVPFRQANVHCDPLQFFSEFGLVGMGCFTAFIGILFLSYFKSGMDGTLSRWIACGVAMVLLHSLIDLPFRCPAILYEWCLLAAVLPRLTVQGRDVPDPFRSEL